MADIRHSTSEIYLSGLDIYYLVVQLKPINVEKTSAYLLTYFYCLSLKRLISYHISIPQRQDRAFIGR